MCSKESGTLETVGAWPTVQMYPLSGRHDNMTGARG